MFLGARELLFARGRFSLMGAVVALIALLVVLLSGLSTGLVNDGVSGLQRLPVTAFAFAADSKTDSAFSRSVVTLDQVDVWAEQPGVAEAAPFGNALVNGSAVAPDGVGTPVDLALFGVETDSFLAPTPADGADLGDDPTGIVISGTLVDDGVTIGDTIVLDRLGTELTVVGALGEQHTYGHVDVAYVPLRTWQEVQAGARPGEEPREGAYTEATAVALAAEDGTDLDVAAGDEAADTRTLTLEESFGGSPGYTAETSTLSLIEGFLFVISALVIGAFFTVWTINRRHELAVIRAMGATSGYLVRDTVAQAAVVLVVSTGVGVLVGLGVGALLSGSAMPFALEAGPITGAALALVVLGLLGAAAAATRISRIDPLTALGGQR
ncbi:ABC transporter permease [Blastococcus sp. TML/C7B]|uniref:FtsX-like permease family protein n=1 Tax=Blastococcus sp. TML/C7B TaxID=2798728 RepID=UPI00190C8A78|nr:ABC transporter permease [Blastococcus sp. TML/C7B]MBN1095534.1 ABC transporter permease [Blastococcus sp. TML/C7B]